MKTTYSLHQIVSKDVHPFSPEKYSRFKYGDLIIAKEFGIALAEGFIEKHGDLMLEQEEIYILPSPYHSIPTASNFLTRFFKNHLNLFLFKHGKKTMIETKIHRNHTYVTDYGNLDFDERLKLISNDTYRIDTKTINGKFNIFVDDIKITGSHELTVENILKQNEISGHFVFVYFAELMNKEIHPNIENHYNYFAMRELSDFVELIAQEEFQFNTRLIKYLLKSPVEEMSAIISALPHKVEEIFYLAISNNYHQIEEYAANISLLKWHMGDVEISKNPGSPILQ